MSGLRADNELRRSQAGLGRQPAGVITVYADPRVCSLLCTERWAQGTLAGTPGERDTWALFVAPSVISDVRTFVTVAQLSRVYTAPDSPKPLRRLKLMALKILCIVEKEQLVTQGNEYPSVPP